MLKLIFICVAILLAGCASKERREARAECSVDAMRQYPPIIERQMVNKSRLVSVPDGTMNCTTIGTGQFATTNCVAGTRLESIPYTAVENVDMNKNARDAVETACTDRKCYQRFGNSQCKVGK